MSFAEVAEARLGLAIHQQQVSKLPESGRACSYWLSVYLPSYKYQQKVYPRLRRHVKGAVAPFICTLCSWFPHCFLPKAAQAKATQVPMAWDTESEQTDWAVATRKHRERGLHPNRAQLLLHTGPTSSAFVSFWYCLWLIQFSGASLGHFFYFLYVTIWNGGGGQCLPECTRGSRKTAWGGQFSPSMCVLELRPVGLSPESSLSACLGLLYPKYLNFINRPFCELKFTW